MDDLKEKYLAQIEAADSEAALEDLRLAAVGKKGEVSLKMRELGKMTPEERQVAGPALNALKNDINAALSARKMALRATTARRMCGAPIPHRCRSARCWSMARRSASSARAGFTAPITTRPTRRCSIRSKGWRSTAIFPWRT